jgi:hypothetical protein
VTERDEPDEVEGDEILAKKMRLIMDLSLRVSLLSQENERLKRAGAVGSANSDPFSIARAAEF